MTCVVGLRANLQAVVCRAAYMVLSFKLAVTLLILSHLGNHPLYCTSSASQLGLPLTRNSTHHDNFCKVCPCTSMHKRRSSSTSPCTLYFLTSPIPLGHNKPQQISFLQRKLAANAVHLQRFAPAFFQVHRSRATPSCLEPRRHNTTTL